MVVPPKLKIFLCLFLLLTWNFTVGNNIDAFLTDFKRGGSPIFDSVQVCSRISPSIVDRYWKYFYLSETVYSRGGPIITIQNLIRGSHRNRRKSSNYFWHVQCVSETNGARIDVEEPDNRLHFSMSRNDITGRADPTLVMIIDCNGRKRL